MAPDGLIAAFRGLATADSRNNAIQDLLRELTPYEWRRLHALTTARSFDYDIIGQLPVEVVAQIFVHLPPATPFRLQSVSKRWRHILSSLAVVKPSLEVWLDGTSILQGADYATCTRKARDVHAFRHGHQPHTSFELVLKERVRHALLTENTLIWTCDFGRLLYVFNIRTWSLNTVCGDAREAIQSTFASDQLVGFTSNSGFCYAIDLLNLEKRKFKTLNYALLSAISCRERTVAYALHSRAHFSIYIWNYDTQRGTSFTENCAWLLFNDHHSSNITGHYSLAVLLQPKDECIIVFVAKGASIRYATFRYTGERIRDSDVTIQGLPTLSFYRGGEFLPADRQGTFRVTAWSKSFGKALRNPTGLEDVRLSLRFDEQLYRYTQPGDSKSESDLWISEQTSWWKDTFFISSACASVDSSNGPADPILRNTRNTARGPFRTLIDPHDLSDGGVLGTYVPPALVNDKVIVQPANNRLVVLCYDSSLDLANEDGPFFGIGKVKVLKATGRDDEKRLKP